MTEPTIIAVDWSGAKKTNLSSGIWLAVVQDGRVVHSAAVRSREEAVGVVIDHAPPVIAGFDFSFSVPGWFARDLRCTTVDDVWEAAAREGEHWLAPTPPFWRKRCEVPVDRRFRRCELELRPAKSIFQLVGNGQVGAGSVRGMPSLARLRAHGFAIWPFDAPGARTAVEIYPSRLRRLGHAPAERAYATEHERDAVESAEVMWDHRALFPQLTAATDPVTLIEGDVWMPS